MPSNSQSTWIIGPISTPHLTWGAKRGINIHQCPTCNLILLTGESSGFCCGPKGSKFQDVPILPPLPTEFECFLNDPTISEKSRILNLIFSFASLESTHAFPQILGSASFVAIQGKIYHRLRPTHENSAVRWLLHDAFMDNTSPHSNWADTLPITWKNALKSALLRLNPFAISLSNFSSLNPKLCPNAQLIIEDSGTTEIAAIISYENTSQAQVKSRTLYISRTGGGNSTISAVSRLWEPLAYPLFFPQGTLGWGITGNGYDLGRDITSDSNTTTTQMWHYRARLLREPRFQIFGRLANEYIVDMFTRDLETRLTYIRNNQQRLRMEDAALMGVPDIEPSENIYLPSSFLGSNRWASEQIADSLTIASQLGNPTFFVTMTCNPDWEEITSQLRPGQNFSDIPVVVVRVFKRKLSLLLQTLKTMFSNAGKLIYSIHVVEFQKRGLPHAHILIKFASSCVTPEDIDAVVSAEMPIDLNDAMLIRKFMLHKHPPSTSPISKYCQHENNDGSRSCRFKYPHPLQQHTTIDAEGRIQYRRRNLGDEIVVPHCLPLIRKFLCHINFEVASASHIFQYLFKYIHKGPDKTRYRLQKNLSEVDEIEDYWNARYLSAGEAAWRIMGFHITKKDPSVTALPIHLPDSKVHRQYMRVTGCDASLSLLEHYFLRPFGNFIRDGIEQSFRNLSYTHYYGLFRLAKHDESKDAHPRYFLERPNPMGSEPMHVILRQSANVHLTRIHNVSPSHGEIYYLRKILQHHAVDSFIGARTVDGEIRPSYQDAANELGLFAEHDEGTQALMEGITNLSTPRQLRSLFIHLLINDCLPLPVTTWELFRNNLSFDFSLQHGNSLELGINHALSEMAQFLDGHGHTLSDYGLPQPTLPQREVLHELERWSSNPDELRNCWTNAIRTFNDGQRIIFDLIANAAIRNTSCLIFVDGKAGTGKTTVVNEICNFVRSRQQIVLPTATSAFAAQHYAGGRTTHSTFKVPVNETNELLTSSIKVDDARADLIRNSTVLIWDEAPMANKAVLACVDDVCRLCTGSDLPFGGKIMILLGDFRQTAPIIRRGTRVQIIDASIKSSHLWPFFSIYPLHRPIRNAQDINFCNFVNAIGDGMYSEIPLTDIPLATTITIENVIDFVFPLTILANPVHCLHRAILAPTNAQVDMYNNHILQMIAEPSRTYLAADSLKEAEDANILPPDSILDYVTKNTPLGMPSHSITITRGGVYRLLRNFSIERGLVKNARVSITQLGHRLISVRLLHENSNDVNDLEDILIPRITFTTTLHSGHTLLRRQFPLAPAYATTFNSCQGLTLDRVGIDLTKPVFSHGQLYTAMSRIRKRQDGIVRVLNDEDTVHNVSYSELLLPSSDLS